MTTRFPQGHCRIPVAHSHMSREVIRRTQQLAHAMLGSGQLSLHIERAPMGCPGVAMLVWKRAD